MKYLSFFILIMISCTICNGQDNLIFPPKIWIIKQGNEEIRTSNLILYLLDTYKFQILERSEIEAMGIDKKFRVEIVYPKSYVKLVNLTFLFDKYHIDKKFRELPVRIDGLEKYNSHDILAYEKAVTGIKKEGSYINVITTANGEYERFLLELEKDKLRPRVPATP